jgi:hypothetical protein
MSINSYTESILSSINFVQDYRFVNVDTKFAELCEINLINYLQYLIQIYHSDNPEGIIENVNAKKEELLGESTLGEFSPVLLYEALYYYRLMLIPDKLMQQLVHVIDLYNSEHKMKAISKINSLITFNICTYGAGTSTEKPLLDLTVHEGVSKEQKDLEVSIMFLLRNINDLNLTLAEPLYGHPVTTLLADSDDEDELESDPKPKLQVAEEQEQEQEIKSKEENNEEDLQSKFNKMEFTLFSFAAIILIVSIAIIMQQYVSKGANLK